MTDAVREPVSVSFRPGTGSLRSDLDYPDESIQSVPPGLLGDDPISSAIGSYVYVENAGRQWAPWAFFHGPLGTTVDVVFDRFYPHRKIAVDVLPAGENLEPEVKAQLDAQADAKRNLCAANGCVYLALYEGDDVLPEMFAKAQAWLDALPPVVTEATDESAVAAQDEQDDISRAIGHRGYIQDAQPGEWAMRYATPGAEWTGEAIKVTRFYFALPMAVDVFPRRDYLTAVDAARLDNEIRFKRKLFHKHRLPYLVVWGDEPPTTEEIARARQRAGLTGEDAE